jgi:hypothetical protein
VLTEPKVCIADVCSLFCTNPHVLRCAIFKDCGFAFRDNQRLYPVASSSSAANNLHAPAQPGKGGRGGGKAEASGAGGSADLSKHLGALQVAAGQHVSSRSAQVRRPRPRRSSGAAAPRRWRPFFRLRRCSGPLCCVVVVAGGLVALVGAFWSVARGALVRVPVALQRRGCGAVERDRVGERS